MLERKIQETFEGTKTINIPRWNESYHSINGVLDESTHVFIKNGLYNKIDEKEINILEMGFGTGLNCFLSIFETEKNNLKINYYTIEKYPLSEKELLLLEYWNLVKIPDAKEIFFSLHNECWQKKVSITKNFSLKKFNIDFFDLEKIKIPPIDIVYFDAFSAKVQPELWQERLFQIIYNKMGKNSLLTTYSSKGSARRAMQSVGFEVKKLSGANGKREMVNAWKN